MLTVVYKVYAYKMNISARFLLSSLGFQFTDLSEVPSFTIYSLFLDLSYKSVHSALLESWGRSSTVFSGRVKFSGCM